MGWGIYKEYTDKAKASDLGKPQTVE